MSQFFMRCPKNAGDWILIEMQGELSSDEHTSFQAMSLGKLKILDDGTPMLEIGNHLLEGKFEKLKKPIMVTQKDSSSSSQFQNPITGSTAATEFIYEVRGIIRQKLVFKNRPKPIVTAPMLR